MFPGIQMLTAPGNALEGELGQERTSLQWEQGLSTLAGNRRLFPGVSGQGSACQSLQTSGPTSDARAAWMYPQECSVMLLGLRLTLGKVHQLLEELLGQQTPLIASFIEVISHCPLTEASSYCLIIQGSPHFPPLGGSGDSAQVGRAALCSGRWERVCTKAGIATAEGMG